MIITEDFVVKFCCSQGNGDAMDEWLVVIGDLSLFSFLLCVVCVGVILFNMPLSFSLRLFPFHDIKNT